MMDLDIKTLTAGSLDDLDTLFSCKADTNRCWCMWFMMPVKAFHANGAQMNQRAFRELLEHDPFPLGLIAYDKDEPIGWCAVGPRSRYARAIKTPSYEGRDPDEDDHVWLTPCFVVKKEARGQGVMQAMLKAACALATEHGAVAVEGFPFAASGNRESKVAQVGFESVFAKCGFSVSRKTTAKRVVMRYQIL